MPPTKPSCVSPAQPRIAQKDEAPEGQMAFDATFEVYPDVKIGDLSGAEVERVSTEVTEAAIDRTVDILRKQRRTFAQRPSAEGAAETDRVTIDFEGKIDGEPFAGGKADAFQFIIGEGQMLEQFDTGVRGMKVGAEQDLPAEVPGRLPGPGRGRQGSRLHGHDEEDRGPAPADRRRRLRQGAGHQGRHRRGAARRRQEEPRARGQVPRHRAQQGRGDGRGGPGRRTRPAARP